MARPPAVKKPTKRELPVVRAIQQFHAGIKAKATRPKGK